MIRLSILDREVDDVADGVAAFVAGGLEGPVVDGVAGALVDGDRAGSLEELDLGDVSIGIDVDLDNHDGGAHAHRVELAGDADLRTDGFDLSPALHLQAAVAEDDRAAHAREGIRIGVAWRQWQAGGTRGAGLGGLGRIGHGDRDLDAPRLRIWFRRRRGW